MNNASSVIAIFILVNGNTTDLQTLTHLHVEYAEQGAVKITVLDSIQSGKRRRAEE